MTIAAATAVMGMPVSVQLVDEKSGASDVEAVFAYLAWIDRTFSPFKAESETGRINRGELALEESSPEMRFIAELCERTKSETRGYFDARYRGEFDPSGAVKGYAIDRAAELLRQRGHRDFLVEAGGDIQVSGRDRFGDKWKIGIRNPFLPDQLATTVYLCDQGIATSGSYFRGEHIVNPSSGAPASGLASITVVAGSVCDADRFATAAYAMGEQGIDFVNEVDGLEACSIGLDGSVRCTAGFMELLQP